jgi:hypothetical protein
MARGDARRSTRAQALVETAIVVVMLTFMIMGIVEVGWAFMRTSMIEHAARDGGRYGATLGNATGIDYRDATTGCFTGGGTTKIQNRVTDQLTTIGFTPAAVAVCQACDGTIPITKVTITGTIDMLFGFIPGTFGVDRQFTFQDEARACPTNACGGC